MAARRTRNLAFTSGLVIGRKQLLLALFDAIFLVCPFAQVDQLAAFAAKRAEAVAGIPLMLLATLRADNNRRCLAKHYDKRLQKVRSNGTSCSNSVDFAA